MRHFYQKILWLLSDFQNTVPNYCPRTFQPISKNILEVRFEKPIIYSGKKPPLKIISERTWLHCVGYHAQAKARAIWVESVIKSGKRAKNVNEGLLAYPPGSTFLTPLPCPIKPKALIER